MARRADVPFGAVHYHWGSKKELWQAVIRRISERTQETVLRNLVPGRTLGETLDNIVDAFLELLIAHPNTARLSHRMVLESRDLGAPGVRAMVREMGEFGVAVLREQLPAGSFDGPAALLIVSNAFLGAVLDADGQEALLGGAIATSAQARARLRAELKRVMRAIFQLPENSGAPRAVTAARTRTARRRRRGVAPTEV
jgi:AcrR family transcriptional regulator